jgi:hypothetical protein
MNRLGNQLLAVACLWATITVGQGITAAEYFWDSDPGAGNGTAMTAQDGNFGDALEAILLETSTLPSVGPHVLGIRARDINNTWGPVFSTVVVVEPSLVNAPEIRVSLAEYFWDTDPGAGSGMAMVAFDGNFNAALEQILVEATALPAPGAHVLGMRARDANNAWGPVFRVVVDVMQGAVSFPEIRISAAEYYLNDDPGEGAGTPMLASDGNFDAALEAIRGGGIPVPVLAGPNVLYLRARDPNNNWGPSFGIVVSIDTTITGTVSVPEFMDDRHVVLLPNPAINGDGFLVRLSEAMGVVRVLLVDAGGRQVAEHHFQGGNELRVPLHGLAGGMYHVGVLPRDGRATWRKLLVH